MASRLKRSSARTERNNHVDRNDGSTVTVCTWAGGVAGSEVVLYTIEGGGHAPPAPNRLPMWYRFIVGPKNHDISAADEVWTFFERHQRFAPRARRTAGRRGR